MKSICTAYVMHITQWVNTICTAYVICRIQHKLNESSTTKCYEMFSSNTLKRNMLKYMDSKTSQALHPE